VATLTAVDSPPVEPQPHDRTFSIVCLSSQRWEAALPTNRQQVMMRAARQGHQVVFVETADFVVKRAVDQARTRLPVRPPGPNVRVEKLINVLPFSQRFRWANAINFRFGAADARRAAKELPAPRVLWIYDPRGAAAIGAFGEDLVVYDCVDYYAEQANTPRARRFVAQLDKEVATRADLVFATTERLRERHDRARGGVHLVPNAGDFDHFRPAADPSFADRELAALPRPILGFAGNIIESKVDLDLLDQVASAFPTGTLLLVGPVQAQLLEHVQALSERRTNVRWTGLRPYDTLPSAVAAFDVALIPYTANEYTRSVFPLKVYEYLAAGKPVVAAGVPSVARLHPHVRLAESPEAFVAAVEEALAAPGDATERIAVAAANTWEHRAMALLRLIDGELERAPARRH
jgi:glycosyltransferase involved in cell wall biosynthesis